MTAETFTTIDRFINESTKAITAELNQVEKMLEEGIDINNILDEIKEKVEALRTQANDMISYAAANESNI